MASGTITLKQSASSGSYIVAKIIWSATADSAANASKDVTAKLYVRKDSTDTTLTIATKGTWTYKLAIAGNSISGSVSASVLTDWVLVATYKVSSISHNDDGSGFITLSGSVSAPSGTSFAGHTTSGSDTAKLDSIARASTITSASAVTLGNKCSVKWTPAATSFRYKLKFVLGDWNYTTAAIHPNKTSAYTYTGYTIPLAVANQLPKAKNGTMTVYLYTYSDNGATTQIGSADSETFTVTVPDSAKPTVTMELSPAGSLASAFDGLFIQGKTKVQAALSAEGKYGATISSYSMSVEGSSYGSSAGYTSGFLADYGELTVTGSAKDSRGFTGTAAEEITVIPYSKPKILPATGESEVVAARCDADGNLDDSGTYLKIKAKRSYSPVKSGNVQKNFCQIRFRYRTEKASGYSGWTAVLEKDSLDSDEIITDALMGGALAVDTTYIIQVGVIDDIGESTYTTVTVPTDRVYMHRDGARRSLALFKYIEDDSTVDIADDITVKVRGELVLPKAQWISLGLSEAVAETTVAYGRSESGCYYTVSGDNHVYIQFNCSFEYSGSSIIVNSEAVPSALRPGRQCYAFCATSGKVLARVHVTPAGWVKIEWVQSLLSATETMELTSRTWIDGYIDYWL